MQACAYQSSKSYGAKETNTQNIYIGSSAKNSIHFAEIVITKRKDSEENFSFKLSIDGVILKEAKFKNNKGKPGGMIKKIKTKLKSIKSLC